MATVCAPRAVAQKQQTTCTHKNNARNIWPPSSLEALHLPPQRPACFCPCIVCMYVCMYACMYVCMHACMHACMCVYVCMYVCVCVCVLVCMRVCACRVHDQVLAMHVCVGGHEGVMRVNQTLRWSLLLSKCCRSLTARTHARTHARVGTIVRTEHTKTRQPDVTLSRRCTPCKRPARPGGRTSAQCSHSNRVLGKRALHTLGTVTGVAELPLCLHAAEHADDSRFAAFLVVEPNAWRSVRQRAR